jgi:hypothetical protein
MDNKIQAVIGINDHPTIKFYFDTHNFHDPDTVWFLDSISFDGCDQSCPKLFYEEIIKFCQERVNP